MTSGKSFHIQRSAGSTGGYTLMRQATEAVGTVQHFLREEGLGSLSPCIRQSLVRVLESPVWNTRVLDNHVKQVCGPCFGQRQIRKLFGQGACATRKSVCAGGQ